MEHEAGLYHVINRGNYRSDVFSEPQGGNPHIATKGSVAGFGGFLCQRHKLWPVVDGARQRGDGIAAGNGPKGWIGPGARDSGRPCPQRGTSDTTG